MIEILRFLSLCIGYGLNGLIWNSLPIIFYRPYSLCIIDGQQIECDEFEACNYIQNQYNYKSIDVQFISKYEGVNSIPIEFELFCDRKLIETNILTIGLLCSLFGCIIGLLYHAPKYKMQYIFMIIYALHAVIFFVFYYSENIYIIALFFCIWNCITYYNNCIIYTYITDSFKGKLNHYGATLCNMIWCCVSISYIIQTVYVYDWRYNLGLFGFYFSIIIVACLYIFRNKEEIQQGELEEQNKINESHISLDFFYDFKKSLNKFKLDQDLKKNGYLWTLAIITVNTCYTLCILVLNTFVGNLYANAIGSTSLELFANSLSGLLILYAFNLKKTIINIYLIMGITYIACLFIDNTGNAQDEFTNWQVFLKLIPIIVGKGTHDVLWTILYSYLKDITPQENQQFLVSNSQILSILASAIIPYYKYFMEYFQLNYFIILSVLCFLTSYLSQGYKVIKEQDILSIINSKKQSQDIPLIDLK